MLLLNIRAYRKRWGAQFLHPCELRYYVVLRRMQYPMLFRQSLSIAEAGWTIASGPSPLLSTTPGYYMGPHPIPHPLVSTRFHGVHPQQRGAEAQRN